jgi:hypothetical protein
VLAEFGSIDPPAADATTEEIWGPARPTKQIFFFCGCMTEKDYNDIKQYLISWLARPLYTADYGLIFEKRINLFAKRQM